MPIEKQKKIFLIHFFIKHARIEKENIVFLPYAFIRQKKLAKMKSLYSTSESYESRTGSSFRLWVRILQVAELEPDSAIL